MRYLYENSPERYAQDVVYSMNLTPPVDIYSVCNYYDIKVYYEDINVAEAYLIVAFGKKSIIINTRRIQYIPRQRFTIAHEIGHFFIPWHKSQCVCDKIGNFDPLNSVENEADIFASELLIPIASILPRIEGRTVTLDLIKELAQEYNVSLTAMAKKVIDNTDEKVIALIYYNDGAKYPLAISRTFDFNLKPGIIKTSAAKDLLLNRYRNEFIKRILRFDVWFHQSDNNDFEIVEESLYQPYLNRVFTILRTANDFDYFDAFLDR